jgi:hypothetical protein
MMHPLGVKKIGCYMETLKEQSLPLNSCPRQGGVRVAITTLLKNRFCHIFTVFIIHNTGLSQLLKEMNHSHLVFTQLVRLAGDYPSSAFQERVNG